MVWRIGSSNIINCSDKGHVLFHDLVVEFNLMKETKIILIDPVKIVKQVEIKKHRDLIGRMVLYPGQILYEFNKKTMELGKAKFNTVSLDIVNGNAVKQVDIQENCFYVYAINAKNAVRKIKKRFKVPFIIEILDEQPTG